MTLEKISAAGYLPPVHHWPIANSNKLILIAEHLFRLGKSHQITSKDQINNHTHNLLHCFDQLIHQAYYIR